MSADYRMEGWMDYWADDRWMADRHMVAWKDGWNTAVLSLRTPR